MPLHPLANSCSRWGGAGDGLAFTTPPSSSLTFWTITTPRWAGNGFLQWLMQNGCVQGFRWAAVLTGCPAVLTKHLKVRRTELDQGVWPSFSCGNSLSKLYPCAVLNCSIWGRSSDLWAPIQDEAATWCLLVCGAKWPHPLLRCQKKWKAV